MKPLPAQARKIIGADEITKWSIDWAGRYLRYISKKLYNANNPEIFETPKIFLKDTSQNLTVVPDLGEYDADTAHRWYFTLNTVYGLIPHNKNSSLITFTSACLNSQLFDYLYKILFGALTICGGYIRFREYIQYLAIRHINFTTPTDERERLTRETTSAYEIGDNAGVLQRVQAHIDSNKTDVVHDLLAHLAQRMNDLNKQRDGGQAFLGLAGETAQNPAEERRFHWHRQLNR